MSIKQLTDRTRPGAILALLWVVVGASAEPPAAGEDFPLPRAEGTDLAYLINGDRLSGTLLLGNLTLHTPLGRASLPKEQLAGILIDGP